MKTLLNVRGCNGACGRFDGVKLLSGKKVP